VYRRNQHGVRTRTVLDSALSVGTLPGALLRTLVAQQANVLAAREVVDCQAMRTSAGRIASALGAPYVIPRTALGYNDSPMALA